MPGISNLFSTVVLIDFKYENSISMGLLVGIIFLI